ARRRVASPVARRRSPAGRPVPLRLFSHPPAPTEIYTLSLHDALPISPPAAAPAPPRSAPRTGPGCSAPHPAPGEYGSPAGSPTRSEEHTSELQSREKLVCRLPLEKKNDTT